VRDCKFDEKIVSVFDVTEANLVSMDGGRKIAIANWSIGDCKLRFEGDSKCLVLMKEGESKIREEEISTAKRLRAQPS